MSRVCNLVRAITEQEQIGYESNAMRKDVVIIGGGLNGLTQALALGGYRCRQPLAVAVVDKADPQRFANASHDSRASALTSATIAMLQAMGVWDEMALSTQAMDKVIVTDAGVSQVRDSLLSFVAEHQMPARFIENHTMFRGLLSAIAQSPNITLVTGQEINGIDYGPGLARVRLANGATITANLVVGADGRNSLARTAAKIEVETWPYPQSALTLTVGHELPHGGQAEEHFHAHGVFAILPLTGNRSSLVWTMPQDEAQALCAMADDAFLTTLAAQFGSHRGKLALLSPRHAYPLAMILAKSMIGPRLALIGDAAHVIHPLAGLGLNLGFKDVAALSEVVMDAQALGQDPGSSATLEAYARWRRFDTQSTAALMHGMHFLFANDHTSLRLMRQTGLKLIDGLPAVKRVFEKEAAGLTGDLPRLMRGLAA